MKVWFAAAAVVLLVGGAAGGYTAATDDDPVAPPRTTFDTPAPMAAEDPSIPVEVFLPDPDDATLKTGIDLRQTLLTSKGPEGRNTKYSLSLPVPVGWVGSMPLANRFQFVVPGNDALAFGVRIDILASSGRSVEGAIQSRESELRSALAQDNFTDLDIEDDPSSNSFTAVYVRDGYQRYSLERFYPGPDPDLVYAAVAVYGRARDVPGMKDLLERISISLSPVVAD